MTQEEKDLLLKYLCAALPYGVYIESTLDKERVSDKTLELRDIEQFINGEGNIKPYLRPISSMTDEEWEECLILDIAQEWDDSFGHHWELKPCYKLYDWLNAHHFDYRELIDKGLAIEVTEENNSYN